GPQLTMTLATPDGLAPGSLALSSHMSGALEVYVAGEGTSDAIASLNFTLDPAQTSVHTDADVAPQVTAFLPLPDSSLGTVATLVTGSRGDRPAIQANATIHEQTVLGLVATLLIGDLGNAPVPQFVPGESKPQSASNSSDVSSYGINSADRPFS